MNNSNMMKTKAHKKALKMIDSYLIIIIYVALIILYYELKLLKLNEPLLLTFYFTSLCLLLKL